MEYGSCAAQAGPSEPRRLPSGGERAVSSAVTPTPDPVQAHRSFLTHSPLPDPPKTSLSLARGPSQDGPDVVLARLLQAGTPWSDHLHFDPDQRWFRRVGEQDGHDVWLLSLMPGQGTGLHDHVGSSGAFGVISGALTEVTVRGRGAGLTIDWVRWTAGEVRLVPRGRVHQLRNDTVARAVSLHVYSPMLRVTTEYAVRAEGLVRVAEERGAW